MHDRENVISEIEDALSDNLAKAGYIYGLSLNGLKDKALTDALALLKEQEEREKRICKTICDFIRGSCSTDTYADKEFVCHEIQKCFMGGREANE